MPMCPGSTLIWCQSRVNTGELGGKCIVACDSLSKVCCFCGAGLIGLRCHNCRNNLRLGLEAQVKWLRVNKRN